MIFNDEVGKRHDETIELFSCYTSTQKLDYLLKMLLRYDKIFNIIINNLDIDVANDILKDIAALQPKLRVIK